MALRLQTPSQTFLLTHTTAKYLCALCTVHSAVHQVDFAHCVVYSEVLVLACIGVTLRSLPFLHHLTVTEIQRPLLFNIINNLLLLQSPPPRKLSNHHQLPPWVERQGGCLLQRLVRDIYGAFTPPPFSL